MQLLFYILEKYKNFLLFVVLQLVALALIVQNNSFQRSRFLQGMHNLTGGIHQKSYSIKYYFSLADENKKLAAENAQLRSLLNQKQVGEINTQQIVDSIKFRQKYSYTPVEIINNSYHLKNNFITLNLGKNQGIDQDMAVVSPKGILGITAKSSSNYTTAISILNPKAKINARFKKNDFFGTLTWNGKHPNTVQLNDIPRHANVKLGDTIITGGMSSIFPEGIAIGTVQNIELENKAYKEIDVALFNDMTKIKNAYIIHNFEQLEIEQLETETKNER